MFSEKQKVDEVEIVSVNPELLNHMQLLRHLYEMFSMLLCDFTDPYAC